MQSIRLPLAALTFAFGLLAQGSEPIGDTPEPQPTNKLLSRLKSRQLEVAAATEICNELQYRATRARLTALTVLRTRFLKLQKQMDKDGARTLSRCERAATAIQKQRLEEGGQPRILQLRSACMKVTRSRNLQKGDIKKQIDPRLDELRSLLMPSVKDLYEFDGALRDATDKLTEQHEELREWHRLYRLVSNGLELHPDADKHFKKNPPPDPPKSASAIDEAVALASFAGLPMTGGDKKALKANESLRGKIDEQELLGTLELNRIRYALGLPLVTIDTKLSDAARDHSKDMHTMNFFSHTSPVAGKKTFGKRAANFGTSAASENIAAGQSTGKGAITAWWYSPGHHKNMMAKHRRVGLGRHENMWTQMFGG